jgi:hypothetical protein
VKYERNAWLEVRLACEQFSQAFGKAVVKLNETFNSADMRRIMAGLKRATEGGKVVAQDDQWTIWLYEGKRE